MSESLAMGSHHRIRDATKPRSGNPIPLPRQGYSAAKSIEAADSSVGLHVPRIFILHDVDRRRITANVVERSGLIPGAATGRAMKSASIACPKNWRTKSGG